ncbi:MAG TPA: ComEC/Rec2 family competence protein [Mycobacteriales bacterium]|nr:ComEC/Rec2 family competence protein [Mycobacteriales bacterium]
MTDVRLVPPLVAAWLGCLLGLYADPRTQVAATSLVVIAAAVLGWHARRAAWPLLAAAACFGVAVLGSALRADATTSGPLHDLAARRAEVTLEVVVTGDPVQLDGAVVGARRHNGGVLVPTRAELVTVGADGFRLRRPVTVLAAGQGWLGRLPGERLRVQGRLGLPRPGDGVAAVVRAHGPPIPLGRAGLAQRVAGRLRQGLRDATSQLPADARALVPGLVVGDTSRLDDDLREDFRTTGMSHLVAVSGSNCAIFLGAALLLARRLRSSVVATGLVGAVALAGFVLVARPSPSVLRAAVMGAIALVALVTGRSRSGLPLLCGSALLLLLVSPGLAASPGFALSVAATGGLVALAPPWRRRLANRLPGWLADAIAVPLAAQVACTPIIAGLFGQVSLVAVPANLLAMPAVGVATVAGVVTALLAPVAMPLAEVVAWGAGLPAIWLGVVARSFAAAPYASAPWPRGLLGAAGITTLLLAAPYAGRARVVRRAAVAVVPVVWIAAAGAQAVLSGWPPAGWVLAACDVGQGDGLVVRGHDAVLVVDAGPDPASIRACLDDLRVRRVNALVLTHLHADHVEGVPGVLSGRGVAQIVVGPLDEPAEERDRVRRWAERRSVPIRRATAGERWSVGDIGVEVLAPAAEFRGTESDPNNSSLVLAVAVRGLRLLLTGDIEAPAQQAVLSAVPEERLRAHVLKVAHHGSSKNLRELGERVGASVAVTSVGADNPYGHPARSTMSMLRDLGLVSLRTDIDGDVAVGVRRDGSLFTLARGDPRPRALPAAQAFRAARSPELFCRVKPDASRSG